MPSDADVTRVMGWITLLCSVPLGALFIANLRSRLIYHGPNYSFLGWMCLYTIVTGIGLCLSRKWSAILFAFPCYIAGLFLIIGSIFKVPFPGVLINIAVGAVFCISATGILKEWRSLK